MLFQHSFIEVMTLSPHQTNSIMRLIYILHETGHSEFNILDEAKIRMVMVFALTYEGKIAFVLNCLERKSELW